MCRGLGAGLTAAGPPDDVLHGVLERGPPRLEDTYLQPGGVERDAWDGDPQRQRVPAGGEGLSARQLPVQGGGGAW